MVHWTGIISDSGNWFFIRNTDNQTWSGSVNPNFAMNAGSLEKYVANQINDKGLLSPDDRITINNKEIGHETIGWKEENGNPVGWSKKEDAKPSEKTPEKTPEKSKNIIIAIIIALVLSMLIFLKKR